MQTNDKQDEKSGLGVAPISIEKELKTSFLDYAMSVIVSRALPDVRDGLKPVQRRILYAMHTLGYYHNKRFRKSATVVGEVIGKYHPHGDSSIYQAMVGLVQKFSKRYPLLDGQGNWGSIDGDNAAAMRYTETRMAKIAQELLADIEKETVLFVPNYDESTTVPVLLPSKIPNLLINGSNGIAVGMATSIPPHNLGEVVSACIELLKNPTLPEEELFDLVPAPDFPTGGIICGRSGIVKAYRTGHGRTILRGVVDVEENKKHSALIVSEIPYQVNKIDLINKIALLVKNKVIDGISNLRDESDKRGIRLVIELKRGESPQVILNQLYKHTQLQSSVPMLMLALHQNRPMILTLREMIEHFLIHRKEIITRRSKFELKKNKARLHVLSGLIIALDNIDEVIKLIKKSKTGDEAMVALNAKYKLTSIQAKAILEMELQRLTGLEIDKINGEIRSVKARIDELQLVLSDEEVLKKDVIEELEYIKSTYSDVRRSRIEAPVDILSEVDLIPDESMVVTLTKRGYIKRVPLEVYGVQHRGGKGKKGMNDLGGSEDLMLDLFVAKNHDELLFFTNKGRVYSFSVFQVPEASRTAKGRAVVNILPLSEGEHVVKLLCMRGMENKQLVMVTKHGVIKKTNAKAFAKIRCTGIRAVTLRDQDELVFCRESSGTDSIVIATRKGQGIRFDEKEVRSMGRQAAGVRGIRLKGDDYVVGLQVISEDEEKALLFATSNGYGKCVKLENFRVAHRGGMGVRTIPTDKRNGFVIGLVKVSEESNILLVDSNGKMIRLSPKEIRTMGRQAKGVRLIRLDADQDLVSVVAFEEGKEEEEIAEAKERLEQEDAQSEKTVEKTETSEEKVEPKKEDKDSKEVLEEVEVEEEVVEEVEKPKAKEAKKPSSEKETESEDSEKPKRRGRPKKTE